MTLEKPPTTLGENQFESSFLFLENAFYSERNIQQKFSKQTLQLISFSVLNHRLGKCANGKNRTAINVVRPPRFSCPKICNKCSCTTSTKSMQTAINAAVQNLDFCAKNTTELCCTESTLIFVQEDSHLLYGLPRNSCQLNQPSATSISVPNLLYGLPF